MVAMGVVGVLRGSAVGIPESPTKVGAGPESAPLIPAPLGAEATTPIGAVGPEGSEAVGSPACDEMMPVRSGIVVV